MPRRAFTRDTNAEMVVRALKTMAVADAGVNERHDIIVGGKKVSGSAYKIIRERAYHNATLLLRSDLKSLGWLLRSPLKSIPTDW